jgi:hypothetical protein
MWLLPPARSLTPVSVVVVTTLRLRSSTRSANHLENMEDVHYIRLSLLPFSEYTAHKRN